MKNKKISGNEKRKQRLNTLIISPYYLVLISLILIPILIMVLYSFTKGESASLFEVSFTLENYLNFFTNSEFLYAMRKINLVSTANDSSNFNYRLSTSIFYYSN